MKKLIISAIAAVSLLFGFASCSGDLHDEEVPKCEPLDGASWYYTDITIWGDIAEASEGVILTNKAKSWQSANTTFSDAVKAAEGGVLYYYGDSSKTTNSESMLKSSLSDNPAYSPEPGKLRIYVYTDLKDPTLHCWGGSFKETSWPGTPLSKVGEVAAVSYSMTIKNVIVKNIPTSLDGQKVYYRGGLIDSDWKCVEANSGTISEGNVTIPIDKKCTIPSNTGYAKTSDFKIADATWGTAFGLGFDGGNDAANASVLLVDGATVNIVGWYVESNTNRTDKHSCVWYLELAE